MKRRTVVIFSGAGLSQESGIPTFRDSGGLWENHKVEDVASQDGWLKDKELVLDFYRQRYDRYREVMPNAAHFAIARLQEKFNVVNVTQNIDDLLEQAGCENVWHLHGKITRVKCEWHKDISNLDGDTNFTCDYKKDPAKPPVVGETCPVCGGQLRPDVVWFGEAVDFISTEVVLDGEKIRVTPADLVREVKYNDGVFICVGTSAQVYPAAWLIPYFSQVKNKYIVDKNPIKVGEYTLIAGSAADHMPELVGRLLGEGIPTQ